MIGFDRVAGVLLGDVVGYHRPPTTAGNRPPAARIHTGVTNVMASYSYQNSPTERKTPVKVTVVTGTGEAATQLAAFDMALWRGGIANYNLVVLSSVIPSFATVAIEPHQPREDEWGHRLYVVLAQRREIVPGSEAWAGLGWVQDDSGAGLFVEHNGSTRQQVESQIDQSLTSITAYRNRHFGKIEIVTVGIECRDQPVAAVVAAVYEVQPWLEDGTIGSLRTTRG